jgi:hypothetical protein
MSNYSPPEVVSTVIAIAFWASSTGHNKVAVRMMIVVDSVSRERREKIWG